MSEQDSLSLLVHTHAQLLSLAVHEFRTPASVLGGYLRMLQRDTTAPLDKRQLKMVEEAQKACAQMVALVGELNEISKLDDPQTRMRRESFDLIAMIREIVAETTESADRGVTMKIRAPKSSAPITGDILRLHAAIGAVVRAVAKQQVDRASVVVECKIAKTAGGRQVVVVMANSDELSAVATAVHTPFDDKRGGQGLSLPIARRVIERHHGTIWSPPAEKGELGSRRAAVIELPLD